MTHIETAQGPIELRRAIPDDGAALRALRVEALRLHPTAFSSDLHRIEEQTDESWSERIQKSTDQNNLAIWIATTGSAIVGTATMMRESGLKVQHRGLLVAVYVTQAWRGFGLAEAVIHDLLAWAASVGIETVELGVNSTNTAAMVLYSRLGFSVYGLDHDFLRIDSTSYDLILMSRRV